MTNPGMLVGASIFFAMAILYLVLWIIHVKVFDPKDSIWSSYSGICGMFGIFSFGGYFFGQWVILIPVFILFLIVVIAVTATGKV